jgi:hypothetical protein
VIKGIVIHTAPFASDAFDFMLVWKLGSFGKAVMRHVTYALGPLASLNLNQRIHWTRSYFFKSAASRFFKGSHKSIVFRRAVSGQDSEESFVATKKTRSFVERSQRERRNVGVTGFTG